MTRGRVLGILLSQTHWGASTGPALENDMPFLDPRSKPFTPSSRDLETMIESAMRRADAAVARARAETQDAEETRQAEQEARVACVRQRRARWGC